MKKCKIWMAVEANERSLPIAWAEDPGTLAEIVGVKKNTVIEEASRYKDRMHKGRYPKYVKVEVEDDD